MAVSGSLREVPGAGTGTVTAAVRTGHAPDPQHSPSVKAGSFQWGNAAGLPESRGSCVSSALGFCMFGLKLRFCVYLCIYFGVSFGAAHGFQGTLGQLRCLSGALHWAQHCSSFLWSAGWLLAGFPQTEL